MAETIGQRLKKAREYRNLSIEKVETATHIRAQFLRALEEDDFSAISSPVQARGFLRNYAQYLDLDLDQMIEELRADPPDIKIHPEVIYEGEQEEIAQITVEPEEGQSSEPFWQTWLRRVKHESGQLPEEDEAVLSSDLETASELQTTSETEIDTTFRDESKGDIETATSTNLWEAFLNRTNIRISRTLEEEPALEEEPDSESTPSPQPESTGEQEPSSQKIINHIGLQLRQRREIISLTLEEIERHTRMRAQFLAALEKGDFDELPSPVQTRGMLSNYASFLDMDVDALLLQFAEALQARHRERHPEKLAGKRGQPKIPDHVPTLRSFIAGDMIFGVGVVLLLILFSIWGIARVVSLQSERKAEVQAEATGPSISEALIGTPVEAVEVEVTLIPAEDTPIPGIVPEGTFEIPTLDITVNVQVNVVAVERTFMRVLVDGEEVFNGRTAPGNAYSYDGEESVELLVGNAAAVRVIYNQRNLGLLGGFGQVASYIYTLDEIIVPTPEIPPTATNTPFVSPTPSITPSPTATPLPRDAAE